MGPFGHLDFILVTHSRDIFPAIGKRTLCTFEEVRKRVMVTTILGKRPGGLENALEG